MSMSVIPVRLGDPRERVEATELARPVAGVRSSVRSVMREKSSDALVTVPFGPTLPRSGLRSPAAGRRG
jgi:hypothetical protein